MLLYKFILIVYGICQQSSHFYLSMANPLVSFVIEVGLQYCNYFELDYFAIHFILGYFVRCVYAKIANTRIR